MAKDQMEEASPHCAQCGKSGSLVASDADSVTLKVCAKCRSLHYCSRECQKEHWKTHKKDCAKTSDGTGNASASANSGPTNFSHISVDPAASGFQPQLGAGPPSSSGGESPLDLDRMLAVFGGHTGPNPPKALRDAAYLNSLPRKKAHQVIIDSYRLRVEDEYTFQAKNRGLYASEDPYPDFVDYLDRAEGKGGILPKWWNEETRRECERLGQDEGGDCFLGHAVEKEDIIKQYGDRLAPMRIRMIAQLVEGSRVA